MIEFDLHLPCFPRVSSVPICWHVASALSSPSWIWPCFGQLSSLAVTSALYSDCTVELPNSRDCLGHYKPVIVHMVHCISLICCECGLTVITDEPCECEVLFVGIYARVARVDGTLLFVLSYTKTTLKSEVF